MANKITFGDKEVDIYLGNDLVYGWKEKTGNFVTMTSNNAPSPFTVTYTDKLYSGSGTSSSTTISGSDEYKVFDGNISTIVGYAGSHHNYQGITGVKLNFNGKTIIPLEIAVYFDGSASSSKVVYVNGYLNGVETRLITCGASGGQGTTSGTYQVLNTVECDGIWFGASCSPHTKIGLKEVKITKWKERYPS